MCGRYSQTQPAAAIAEHFALDALPPIQPRYNIAPTQPVSVVRTTLEQPQRQHSFLLWGLIPSWAKDPAIGNRLINARSETVSEKPSFRAAFKRRRCLIVADGFYEWQTRSDRKTKQPYYIRLRDHTPFGFAGLWEHWQDPNGSEIETCTILTTGPNALMEPIHSRMPVILEPADYDSWLDSSYYNPGDLQAMLRPFDSEALERYAVSTTVNRPSNDIAECLEPLGGEE
jgi:putative SOS response-associated peptidase YedK